MMFCSSLGAGGGGSWHDTPKVDHFVYTLYCSTTIDCYPSKLCRYIVVYVQMYLPPDMPDSLPRTELIGIEAALLGC